ncbi:MAG TPA: hypothetical protein VMM12_18015 [Longimicrobiales bacterium]|nr:hypothetical protein [Longimicrobiales bacterium]
MSSIKQAMVAVAAVALLAMPATAQGRRGGAGPDGRPGWDGPGSMARNPVTMLLERREALELTADQVRQLETIQARVEQENAPRIARLREALGDRPARDLTAEERAQLRDRMGELQPVRDELRETNRAAMAEARDLLTPEQATALRAAMRRGSRDGGPGARMGEGRQPRHRPAGRPGGGTPRLP